MSLTKEQTIKIENWEAQHNSMLGNISIANKQLEELFSQKLVIEKQILEKKDKLLTKQEELHKVIKRTEEILKDIDSKTKHLNEKEREIELKEQILTKNERELLSKIEQKEKESNKKLSILEKSISKENILLDDIKRSSKKVRNTFLDLERKLKKSRKEEINLNENINRLKLELEKNKIKFEKEYNGKAQILKTIEGKIKEEKEKIKEPLRSLSKREEIIKKKEENLIILIARFKKYYNKHFPNRKLNI